MDIIGELPGPEYKFLCVIGSRRSTSYGKEACKHLIAGLAGRPIAIVSGLALGIDSIAHEAALSAGLKTVAFPGSGISPTVIYPYSHISLARRIAESGGAVVSPFKPDQIGTNWTFPFRNRLMAGISHATLVIEGGRGSGTLLTAGYATEFGRDILAVPGSIFSESSYGPHKLIADGAAAISSPEDILRALDFDIGPRESVAFESIAELSLSPEEKRIIAELRLSPLSSSALIERTSLGAAQFSVLASQLELQGVIAEENGIYRMRR